MTNDHFKEDKKCDWTHNLLMAEAKSSLSLSHASNYSTCDLLGSKRSILGRRPRADLYSIPANNSFSSAVSCFRMAGVPTSLPLMWFTGAIKRILEMSHTASASNKSCGSSGP